jgi:serine/threonine-protein kinase HipA
MTTPSTHILNFPKRDFAGMIDYEQIVMTVARLAGLPAPMTCLVPLPSGRRALLVERFDRNAGRRIRQEDFCHALARSPTRNDEADGGPALAACVDVLTAATVEPRDLLALVRWQSFGVAIGNDDGRAKSLALFHQCKWSAL